MKEKEIKLKSISSTAYSIDSNIEKSIQRNRQINKIKEKTSLLIGNLPKNKNNKSNTRYGQNDRFITINIDKLNSIVSRIDIKLANNSLNIDKRYVEKRPASKSLIGQQRHLMDPFLIEQGYLSNNFKQLYYEKVLNSIDGAHKKSAHLRMNNLLDAIAIIIGMFSGICLKLELIKNKINNKHINTKYVNYGIDKYVEESINKLFQFNDKLTGEKIEGIHKVKFSFKTCILVLGSLTSYRNTKVYHQIINHLQLTYNFIYTHLKLISKIINFFRN